MSLKTLLRPKKCLICDQKCDKVYTTLKYRYEGGKEDEVYVCEKCSNEHDLDENVINGQTL
jgi:protein-arginine kinase activator protein McsA